VSAAAQRTRDAHESRAPADRVDDATVHIVRGDDPALVAQAARALVGRLVGALDPALVVEEHGTADAVDAGAIVDACTTPPFLVDRRVVVVRDVGRLAAADAARLAESLGALAPRVHLVLVAGGGSLAPALAKAAAAAGEVVDAAAGRGRDRSRWFAEHLAGAPVRLDASAGRLLGEHLGEDLGRLEGILESLAAGFGAGATIGEDELLPFLGEAGGVPPWELTDAVDAGDVPASLRALHRMLSAGGRSPLAVLGVLHSHVSNMLRLDGADVVTPEDAAALIGARSAYVAKKALERARTYGSGRIGEAVTLLAGADLDLKGLSALPPEVVLEILVARLARLSRSRPSGRGQRPRPGRGGPSSDRR
jgi:DNA polymerase-3 subunit delta